MKQNKVVIKNHFYWMLEDASSKMISFVLNIVGTIGELYFAQIGSPFEVNCSLKSSL